MFLRQFASALRAARGALSIIAKPGSLFLLSLIATTGLALTGGSSALAAPLPEAYFNVDDVPGQALIGEDVTFKVRFKNAPGASIGYGPFIDLAMNFRGADGNTGGPCDGINFLSAKMTDVSGGPVALAAQKYGNTNLTSCTATSAPHPYAGVGALTIPQGWQISTIELPFGSFDASQSQPDFIVVEIKAHIHNFADRGFALQICARGGFRFGADPNDNPGIDPPTLEKGNDVVSNNWACQKVVPEVIIVSKKYIGAEDETATGPNFVHSYLISVDVAAGQTVGSAANPMTVKDCLTPGMVYSGGPIVTAPPAWGPFSQSFSAGCLTVKWLTPTPQPGVKGTAGPPDATIKFNFWVQNLANCNAVMLPNKLLASGDWTPLDPRDPSTPPVSIVKPSAHKLLAKCLAIQKSAVILPGMHPKPGDIVRYTLDFQVSDYKTIGKIKIVDQLSNGQTLVGTPVLKIGDGLATHTINLTSAYYTSTYIPSYTFPSPPVCPKGATTLTFNIASALASTGVPPRHAAGMLTGNLAATGLLPNSPATGKLVFLAKINDKYTGLQYRDVDKHDPLCNKVDISGAVYQNTPNKNAIPPLLTQPQSVTDNSTTQFRMVADTLKKSVYAVYRPSTSAWVCAPGTCSSGQPVVPGDQVTFRIQYVIPSGDAQSLTIQDWLPLPIFSVTSAVTFNGVCTATVPAPNTVGCLPGNTLFPVPLGVTGDPVTNSVSVNYGTIINTSNTPKVIDLVLTSTVTNVPFADGLFLTNVARECEWDTIDVGRICQTAIAQVKVREPKLNIRKGVIWTGSLKGLFSQPSTNDVHTAQAPSGVTFGSGGVSGTVTSSNLGNLFNSDLSQVDANDRVTFAVIIENTGGYTAYNVRLTDYIPWDESAEKATCFEIDAETLKIRDGAGNALPSPSVSANSFTVNLSSIPASNSSGTNIIIITFQVQMLKPVDLKAGCCENTADLTRYSSDPSPKAPNFVTAGFGGPFHDTARICTGPTASMKCIQATSEVHTAGQQVAIGEIVRYRLITVVPEGTTQSLQVMDLLPVGLTYIPGSAKATFVADNPIVDPVGNKPAGIPTVKGKSAKCPGAPPTVAIIASPSSFPVDTGTDPSFPASPVTVTNKDSDPDQEFLVIEFNAQVDNNVSNQDGTVLSNKFQAGFTDAFNEQPASSTSDHVDVTVVEPKLVVNKTADPTTLGTAGGLVTYTVVITNSGTSDAFDIAFKDTLPSGFVAPMFLMVPTGCTSGISGQVLSVSCVSLPVRGTLTIKYQTDVSGCLGARTNHAEVTWTSLPGLNGTPVGLGNLTGSVTAGPSGKDNGERDGTLFLTVDDYQAADSETVKCAQTGYLKIKKVVVDNTGGTNLPANLTTGTYPNGFPIWLTCSSTPNVWIPVYLSASSTAPGSITSSPSPAGTQCTVVETSAIFTNPIVQPPITPLPPILSRRCPALASWSTTYSPANGTDTIPANGTATITVTNTLNCGGQPQPSVTKTCLPCPTGKSCRCTLSVTSSAQLSQPLTITDGIVRVFGGQYDTDPQTKFTSIIRTGNWICPATPAPNPISCTISAADFSSIGNTSTIDLMFDLSDAGQAVETKNCVTLSSGAMACAQYP